MDDETNSHPSYLPRRLDRADPPAASVILVAMNAARPRDPRGCKHRSQLLQGQLEDLSHFGNMVPMPLSREARSLGQRSSNPEHCQRAVTPTGVSQEEEQWPFPQK